MQGKVCRKVRGLLCRHWVLYDAHVVAVNPFHSQVGEASQMEPSLWPSAKMPCAKRMAHWRIFRNVAGTQALHRKLCQPHVAGVMPRGASGSGIVTPLEGTQAVTVHVGQMALSWLPLEVVKQTSALRRLQSDSGWTVSLGKSCRETP